MRLLYADLPDRPEPAADPDRGRVELMVGGMVAAVGVAVVGSGIIGDLLARSEPEAADGPAPPPPPSTVPGTFTGVERTVGPVETTEGAEVAVAEVVTAPELEFAPPPEPVVDPDVLSAPGPEHRLVAPRTEPAVPAPPAATTTTTVPPSTTTVPPTTTTTVPTTTTRPSDDTPEVRALAATTGFVATVAMREQVAAIGIDGWIEAQLRPDDVADPDVTAALEGFDLLDVDAAALADEAMTARAHAQISWAGFTRAYVSEKQVLEAATATWREHFALALTSAESIAFEQTIRRHALGDYRDLLVAVARTPGVLRVGRAGSVDGTATRPLSTAYARLIAEDFGPGTLTVEEIRAVATVLSGWGLDDRGRFRFDAARHAAAPARVGGWMTPGRAGEAGLDDGVSLIRHLAAMPGTAQRVATLLCRRLAGDGADQRVVDRAASAYGAERTGIGAVVRTALLHAGDGRATDRTGDEWLLAALRALGASVDIGIPWDRRQAGSVPHELRQVGAEAASARRRRERGHPGDWWTSPSAVSARWASARRLTEGAAGVQVDLGRFAPGTETAAHAFIDALAAGLDGTSLTVDERDALLAYLGVGADDLVGPEDDLPLADLVALVLSFPSFMRRDRGATR